MRTVVAILIVTSLARADSISLVNGRTLEGKISFDAKDGLLIVPKNQPSQRIEVRDVLSLQVDGRAPKPPKRTVTLVSGAVIAGSELLLLNDRELRLKRPDNTIFTASASVVSSINFRPDRPLKTPPPANVVGVIVGDGDLSEGDLVSVDEKEVKLSSVLFGLQTFETPRDVRMVLVRPVGVSRAAYVVNATDGSTFHATSLRVDRGKLVLEGDVSGQLQLPGDQVRSIDIGPASADDLSAVVSGASNGAMTLPATGTTDIALGGRYRAMVLTVGVPDSYVPNRAMTFILLADGKEVARAGPLTSVDPPASITRTIDGVTTLTLRTEATGPDSLGVAGQVSSGQFIRAK